MSLLSLWCNLITWLSELCLFQYLSHPARVLYSFSSNLQPSLNILWPLHYLHAWVLDLSLINENFLHYQKPSNLTAPSQNSSLKFQPLVFRGLHGISIHLHLEINILNLPPKTQSNFSLKYLIFTSVESNTLHWL